MVGGRGNEDLMHDGYSISVWGDGNVLVMEGGEGTAA